MDYISLMNTRYACKEFNGKKIPHWAIQKILKAGVLSPSSLGLEPWIFYVLKDKENLEKLKSFCTSKRQFETCSHAIIVASKNDFAPDGKIVKKALKRRDDYEKISQIYAPYLKRLKHRNAHEYGALQAYIAMSNMVNCAASIGVQSCIIGGFEEAQINEAFLQKDEFCAVVLTFGYELNPPKREKIRFDFNDVVKFL